MSLLIINTSLENDAETQNAIEKLTENAEKYKIINTSELNISHCTGCCTCMLDTPGKCLLNDDYKEIFASLFNYDTIVFISDTSFDFINHKTINIIQRMFPLVTVFSAFENGKILHIPRYDLTLRLALLYKGSANEEVLTKWFEKYAEHFSSIPIGVFSINNIEEVNKCIS
ncbi:MAG: flavodoxin family protein [Clostridia bacterium]|nr:flavodoxin family protein [Clostridia bacterium]